MAMEYAMFELTGLHNVLASYDNKTVPVKSTNREFLVLEDLYALKFGVFVDACMRVYDYSIGAGSKTDREIFEASKVGEALVNGTHQSVLNFPNKLKWRVQDGLQIGLEEASPAISMDRSLGIMCNTMIRPFSASYHQEIKFERTSSTERTYNHKFMTGHNVSERFFGAFSNMFPCIRETHNETDVDFVTDTLEILLHVWNVVKDIEDLLYEHYTPLQKFFSNGHLARYAVNPSERISDDESPQTRATSTLLAEYYVYNRGNLPFFKPTGRYVALQNPVYIQTVVKDNSNLITRD